MAVETIGISRTGRTPGSQHRQSAAPLPVGLLVRVRNRFEDRWIPGFSVAEHRDGAYQLRRNSDGCILPAWFTRDAVRSDES